MARTAREGDLSSATVEGDDPVDYNRTDDAAFRMDMALMETTELTPKQSPSRDMPQGPANTPASAMPRRGSTVPESPQSSSGHISQVIAQLRRGSTNPRAPQSQSSRAATIDDQSSATAQSESTNHVSDTEIPSSPPNSDRISILTSPLTLTACLIAYYSDHHVNVMELWPQLVHGEFTSLKKVASASHDDLVELGFPPHMVDHFQSYSMRFMGRIWDTESVFKAVAWT